MVEINLEREVFCFFLSHSFTLRSCTKRKIATHTTDIEKYLLVQIVDCLLAITYTEPSVAFFFRCCRNIDTDKNES